MTDWQEARGALVEEIALLSRGWESNPELRAMRQARDAIDALSVRLAQECALRAQAEQERDEANRWRDSWHDESKAAIATASQFERERNEAEARLREYEEALDKLVPDVRLLVTAYYSGTPDDLKAADAPASRLDAMLFDDDGAPRSVLAPKVAGD